MVALPGYDVRARIGRGGASVVHEATQLSLDRAVAVKLLLTDLGSEDDARRFRRERELLSRLGDHRHVVDVYDAGVSPEGRPYIVMRLCRRGSLADALEATGPMDLASVSAVVTAVASALAFAHGQGVIHRDVKPANILLADDGTPMLADFGVAALAGPEEGTSSSAFTAVHAAPEVVARNEYSVRSDVYSLASTAYVLLTGRNPFGPDRRPDRTPVAPLDRPGLPPSVEAVLARGMAFDPQDRFTAGQDLALALAAATREAALTLMGIPRDRTEADELVETVVTPVPPAVTSADETLSGPVPVTPMASSAGRRSPAFRDQPAVRFAAIGILLLVVVLLGVWVLVGRDDLTLVSHQGQVSLRSGGSVPGFGSRHYESQGIPVSELKDGSRRRLSEGVAVGSRVDAAAVVAGLQAEQRACRTSVADGCPPGPLFRPKTFTATPLAFPRGDQLRVIWSGLDVRPGVVTTLAVDGVQPQTGCPAQLSGADGQCVVTVGYGRTWALTATVTGPPGTRKTTARAGATTGTAPVAKVFGGKTFTQQGNTYCSGLVEVTGFPANRKFTARISASNSTPTSVGFTTDAKGHHKTAEGEVTYGYRDDAKNPIAVDVSVGGITGRTEKWRC